MTLQRNLIETAKLSYNACKIENTINKCRTAWEFKKRKYQQLIPQTRISYCSRCLNIIL